MKTLLVRLAVPLILLLAAGCQTHRGEPSWRCGQALISLEEAQNLMASCQVTAISQPHSGPVLLTLRNASTVCFRQPRLDWVFSEARNSCPSANITETTE